MTAVAGRQPGSPLVLDCSITMAWCFEDDADPVADEVLGSLASREALVSSVWPQEVVNVLLVAERKDRIRAAHSRRFLELLALLPITVDGHGLGLALTELLPLGRATGLSAYDASYLELAMRRGLPIATLDRRLMSAAAKLGVGVVNGDGS